MNRYKPGDLVTLSKSHPKEQIENLGVVVVRSDSYEHEVYKVYWIRSFKYFHSSPGEHLVSFHVNNLFKVEDRK
jgi:hypothetical protein